MATTEYLFRLCRQVDGRPSSVRKFAFIGSLPNPTVHAGLFTRTAQVFGLEKGCFGLVLAIPSTMTLLPIHTYEQFVQAIEGLEPRDLFKDAQGRTVLHFCVSPVKKMVTKRGTTQEETPPPPAAAIADEQLDQGPEIGQRQKHVTSSSSSTGDLDLDPQLPSPSSAESLNKPYCPVYFQTQVFPVDVVLCDHDPLALSIKSKASSSSISTSNIPSSPLLPEPRMETTKNDSADRHSSKSSAPVLTPKGSIDRRNMARIINANVAKKLAAIGTVGPHRRSHLRAGPCQYSRVKADNSHQNCSEVKPEVCRATSTTPLLPHGSTVINAMEVVRSMLDGFLTDLNRTLADNFGVLDAPRVTAQVKEPASLATRSPESSDAMPAKELDEREVEVPSETSTSSHIGKASQPTDSATNMAESASKKLPKTEPANLVSAAMEDVVHCNVFCNGCYKTIRGVRAKCTNSLCPDYDLCSQCYSSKSTLHFADHQFVKFPDVVESHQRQTFQLEKPVNLDLRTVHNASCDLCDSRIHGIRWKCLQCYDWDCCESCYRGIEHLHPGHDLIPISNPNLLTKHTTSRSQSNLTRHPSIFCDGCHSDIYGIRYKCIHPDCEDFDLCSNCESHPISVHPESHPLVKIRDPLAWKIVERSLNLGSSSSSTNPQVCARDDSNIPLMGTITTTKDGRMNLDIVVPFDQISVENRSGLPKLIRLESPNWEGDDVAVLYGREKDQSSKADEEEERNQNVGSPVRKTLAELEAEAVHSEDSDSEKISTLGTPFADALTLPEEAHNENRGEVGVATEVEKTEAEARSCAEQSVPAEPVISPSPSCVQQTDDSKSIPSLHELDSCYISDVNYEDGTQVPAGIKILKMWHLLNSGQTPWPTGTRLALVGGFGNRQLKFPVPLAKPGEVVECTVDAVSANFPGRYMSYYRLETKEGRSFGDKVWLALEVFDENEPLEGEGGGGSNKQNNLSASSSFHMPKLDVSQEVRNSDEGHASAREASSSSSSSSISPSSNDVQRPQSTCSSEGEEADGMSSLKSDDTFGSLSQLSDEEDAELISKDLQDDEDEDERVGSEFEMVTDSESSSSLESERED